MASLSKIIPNSAGIDIGATKIFIAVEDCEVKSFNTFTDDYLKAIVYLKEHNVTSVAMRHSHANGRSNRCLLDSTF